jgi:hypothetical protein
MKRRIFLDLDGVIADFDKHAERALGTDNIYKFEFIWGPDEFWNRLNANAPDFFSHLPILPDAWVLMHAVRDLDPIILTALPRDNGEHVDKQKRAWVKGYLGSHVKVITCTTKDKPKYCSPGDILVDDRAVNKAPWEAAGGVYVIHTSAGETVHQLRQLGVL